MFKITFLFFAFVLLLACDNFNRSPAEIEQIIAESRPLTEIDRFCKDLPKPPGMKYGYKQLGGNSFTVQISYRYKSSLSFVEMRDYYRQYFDGSGWRVTDHRDENESSQKGLIKFVREKRSVTIEHVRFVDADYAVVCTQEL